MIAFLKRLFRPRRPNRSDARPEPPPAPVAPEAAETPTLAPPEPVPPPAPEPSPAPLAHGPADDELEDDPEDDDNPDALDDASEEDAEGPAADDPTIGRLEPLQISLPEAAEVELARTEAERVALSGPQRVTPNDPAGPGSLAETLVRLEARGLVRSRIVDEGDDGFCILYEPLSAGAAT